MGCLPWGGINHIVKWNRGFGQYAPRRVKVQEGSRRAFSACSLNLVHSARGRALWCGQLGGGALGGHGTLLGFAPPVFRCRLEPCLHHPR